MSTSIDPFSGPSLGSEFSLRDWPKPEPPPRPSLGSALDKTFRDIAADQRQPPQPGKDMTVQRSEATSDIHNAGDVASRIASLERDGVTQLTDPAAIKAMKPAEVVRAQREGRLLQYLSTPNGGGYRQHSEG